MVFEKSHSKDRGGFGESVSCIAPAAERLFNLAYKVDRRSRSADLDEFETGKIVVAYSRMIDQCGRHCRDHRKMCNPLALYQVEYLLRVEFLDHNMASAGARDRMRGPPSVDMKQGDGMKLYVGILDRQSGQDLNGMKVEIPMSHHHALGIGGSTRGVEKLGQVIVTNLWRREIG